MQTTISSRCATRISSEPKKVYATLAAAIGIVIPTYAADKTWKTALDGDFSDAVNWNGGTPTDVDRAVFSVSGTYTVGFTNAAASTFQLLVNAGNVTLAEPYNGFNYDVIGIPNSIVVGQTAGSPAQLTIDMSGYVGYHMTGVDAVVGDQAGSVGTLNIGDDPNGYLSLSGGLVVGNNGKGTLNVNGVLSTQQAFIGEQAGSTGSGNVFGSWSVNGYLSVGNAANTAGHDTLLVTNGASLSVSGTIFLGSSGKLTLDGGGNISASNFNGGNSSNFKFLAGSLSLANSDLNVTSAGLLGSNVSLDTTRSLSISGTTTVSSGGVLTLAGGSLSTGSLRKNGGTINFNSGALNVQSGGLIIDPTAATFSSAALTLHISDSIALGGANPLIIGNSGSASLSLDGGSLANYNTDAYIAALQGSNANVTIGGGDNYSSWYFSGGQLIVGGRLSGTTAVAGGTGHLVLGRSGNLYANFFGGLGMTIFSGSLVTIDGGALSLSDLNAGASGAGGTILFKSGAFSLSTGITVGTGGAIPTGFSLAPSDSFTIGNNLTLNAAAISLAGGDLDVGTLTNTGTARVNYTAGQFFIRNGDLPINSSGPISPNIVLNTSTDVIDVSGTATIGTGGTLTMNGGAFIAGNLVNNTATPVSFNAGNLTLLNDLTIDTFGPSKPLGNHVVIDGTGSFNAQLNVNGLVIGAGGNAQLDVQNTGFLNTTSASIAAHGGSATVNLGTIGTATWTLNNGDMFVGGDASGPGGVGRLNIGSGGALQGNSTTDRLAIYSNGHVILDGGSISIGRIDNAQGGEFQFNSGSITLYNSDLIIGPGGLLGSNVDLSTNRTIALSSGATTVQPGATLAFNGGSLTTQSLNDQGSLIFNSGQLFVVNGGLTIDSSSGLGAQVNVGAGSQISLGGRLTVSNSNSGSLNLAANASINTKHLEIAAQLGSSGTATINGSFAAQSFIVVGGRVNDTEDDTISGGHGVFNIASGAYAQANAVKVFAGSTVNIDGALYSTTVELVPGASLHGAGIISAFNSADPASTFVIGSPAGGAPTQASIGMFSFGGVIINKNASLSLSVTSSPSTSIATNLALNGNATLDLGNQRLQTNAPTTTIRQYLLAGGAATGTWNGTSGITSTWAANDATHRTAVGYKAQPDGTTLVAATLYGDTTLKGSVGLSDYNTLAANFNKPGVWSQGDFDYDGNVTLADYNKLAANFNKSAQPGGGVAAAGAGAAAKAASVTLTGSASPAASVLPPNVVDPGVGKVLLEANPNTGQLYLVGHDSNINSYEVDSAAGKLTFVSQKNHGGYNTLTAQSGSTGLPGSALGQNEDIWATISSAAGLFMAEAYPAGSNPPFDTFGPGLQTFDLNVSGLSAWTAGTPISDLTFKYGNGTGDTLTPAVIDISGASVPEPTYLALAGIAAGGLLSRRRRKVQRL